jgi:hypothetical protein
MDGNKRWSIFGGMKEIKTVVRAHTDDVPIKAP